MNDEDLLARVQHRGRLHGRNEARRAICAVVEALGEFLSPRAFHLLTDQLPDPVRHLVRAASASPVMARPSARTFLAGIAARLLMEGPDAAFTTRVILEELNATGRVITPARFAHLVAPDLRALLCAQRARITVDDTNPAPRRTIRVGPAPARPAASPVAQPAPASRSAAPAAASASRPPAPLTPITASAHTPAPLAPATASPRTPAPLAAAAPSTRTPAPLAPVAAAIRAPLSPNTRPADALPRPASGVPTADRPAITTGP